MPNKRQPPRPRDRIIGARLRAIRKERTELSLEDAAKLLECGLATMSRTENGQRHITTEEVATILTAYRIPAAEREDVIAEARAENASGWWDRPLPGVPAEMGTLASYANDANSLTDWAVSLVPGFAANRGLRHGPHNLRRRAVRCRRTAMVGQAEATEDSGNGGLSAKPHYGRHSAVQMATRNNSSISWTHVTAGSLSGSCPSTCRLD